MKLKAACRGLIGRVQFLEAWALAFGCALGWDAFVLPWTSFLPKAGPAGALFGLAAGGLIIAVIAWNYGFMIRRHPGPGGAYAYTSEVFGLDRGFLCGWILCFTYMSIVWLDATVLSYFLQHATGMDIKFGFRYYVAGNRVGLGNILVSSAAIALAGAICCRSRLSRLFQTAMALVFAACVVACFGAAVASHEGGLAAMGPAFSPDGGRIAAQLAGIVALAPWLFVGFETVSHVSGELAFLRRRAFAVMAASIFTVVAAYALLTLIPTLVPSLETGFSPWPRAVAHALHPNDTAYGTVGRSFGHGGRLVVTIAFFSAVFTNLVGNTVAASRLLAAMARDEAIPAWFGRRNADGSPRNAVLAIAVLALFVFALGETVIGIVLDVAVVGAAVAYAYTSFATYKVAGEEGNRVARATGLAGTLLSAALIVLFVLPNLSSHITTMATESYLVIVCWCIAGLMTFLLMFHRDRRRRFGQSPVVWLVFFAMILFMSVMWARQSAYTSAGKTFDDIVRLLGGVAMGEVGVSEACAAVRDSQLEITRAFLRDGLVHTILTILALGLMLCIFVIARRREREADAARARAKSLFFSTMSHDIRTPLNAIIGFSEMLEEGFQTEEERRQAVSSILVSGKTLLALVNDILDLSKLESGKMEISPEPTDCPRLMREVLEAFRVAGGKAGLELRCRAGEMPALMLDPQRLRQVGFNLLGNAVKFTEKGYIELRVSFSREPGSRAGTFRMDVEDTGCGISPEDLKRIASPYVQVGSKSARDGGTGLGLAICKQLAMAMGGSLDVESELGKGTTFSVKLRGVKVAENLGENAEARDKVVLHPGVPAGVAQTCAKGRVLLADDSKMNILVLKALLKRAGDFEIETAEDGVKALERLRATGAKPFDLVLTDMWMPRLDGEGLVKAIRADPALASLRVIAVTADVELQGRAAELGFDGTLLKPITMATLHGTLDECAAAETRRES